ncbi:MAG TPA: hypothetical protein VLB44_26960, partial [Kofleriaceae bacterium]|nr:hypothetical protein [Kofleriaceae bacterium]
MSERSPLAVSQDTPSAATSPDVADQLLEAYLDPNAAEMQHIGSYELPSDAQVEHVIDMCRALLFPGYAGPDVARLERHQLRELVRMRLDELRIALHRQVYRALHHKRQQELGKNELECADCTRSAHEITARFVKKLPELRA